ncbi:MAG: ferritin-like domain-containing protein [Bacteroidia bacterium]|nr:ferritin-like domain-containing protein [Bacteroidia bacterium]
MKNTELKTDDSILKKPIGRAGFLKYSAVAIAGAGLMLAGCKKDDDNNNNNNGGSGSVDLGSDDIGVLNYAYALEQLEAAFYIAVIANKFDGMTIEETAILTDIKAHEIVHRDFLKAALGTKAIKDLTPDFSTIDFKSRASVLGTAKAFEDLGVSAYNGAGKLIKDDGYLLIAGKIVSVEARHASAIRDLLNPNSKDFAGDDVVIGLGLDISRAPSEVLAIAGKYIKDSIDASHLPTS